MKTVTAEQLCTAYVALFPDEGGITLDNITQLGYWLRRYQMAPDRAVSIAMWYGKVTRALFHALKIEMPYTKTEMLAALQ